MRVIAVRVRARGMGASGGMLLLLSAVGVGCYGLVDGFLREDVGDTLVVAVITTASTVKVLVYVYSKRDVGGVRERN